MKQFIFKVLQQPGNDGNTNCKSTILIKAKNLAKAEEKLNDMGFNLLDSKFLNTTSINKLKKLPVIPFSTFHTNLMLAEQMLEAPEDYGLI